MLDIMGKNYIIFFKNCVVFCRRVDRSLVDCLGPVEDWLKVLVGMDYISFDLFLGHDPFWSLKRKFELFTKPIVVCKIT